ncbi:hypothetical protein K439DRAFT_281668 [Ramaria rubella]|nr:hypothetical protein K439DRAFT_281668 [Ramaria rubella]
MSSSNSTCPAEAAGIFGPCLTRLTAGQAVGISLDLEAGLISSLAVVLFLSLVMRNVIRHYRYPPSGGWSLLRTHIDLYILCLLTFELIHGISAVMSAKWLHEGQLYCSTYCTVQGAMRNTGSTGVALVTLVIAIHTFMVIFFQWIPPKSLFIPLTVLVGVCAFLIAYLSYELSVSRAPDQSFYAPTPYWCWIGPSHSAARIWGQYLWLWLTAFMSILLYPPLYFCVKGNLSYNAESSWKIRISRTPAARDSSLTSHAAKVATTDAMCMLYYPAAYTLLVLPDSIVRFMGEAWQAQGRRLPFAPTLTGSALFGLSGVVNVILFMMTRPNLLLFRSPPIVSLPTRRYKGYPRFQGSGSGSDISQIQDIRPSSPSTGRSIEALIVYPASPQIWLDEET